MKLAKSILLLMLLLPLLAIAVQRTDFSGQWIMDKAKSTGLPENMEQKMRVKQEGDKLELETDLFVGDDVQTIHDSYTFNGQEADFPARLQSGQQTTGKRIAKWNEDGKGFEVRETATFDTPEGKVTTTMQRKWTIIDEGKTIVIELNHTGPNGPISTKRTFIRK